MTLGNRIKELRLQKLLSQEKIAEELGVSRQAVSKWETGLSYPDTENLVAISKVLGISVDELIQIKTEEQKKLEEQKNLKIDLEKNQCKKLNHKPVFSTIFVVGLFALLVVFGGVALFNSLPLTTESLSNAKTPSTAESAKSTQLPNETQTPIDYLNSPDSLQLQEVAQSFAKAYFSGNLEGVKLYLADAEAAEVYEKNIYDNLEYMTLKWKPEDLSNKTTIGVQYQFQEKGTDSATYLGLDFMKISDKWKITSFYLEK